MKALLNAFSQMVSIISMNVNKIKLLLTKGFTIVHRRLWKMVHGSNLNWNRCIKCQYWVCSHMNWRLFGKPVHRRCFIFLFVLLENIGMRESEASTRAKRARSARKKYIFFFPHPYPFALAVNKSPAVFIFYHARSTDCGEKIEGLWTGYFLAGKNDRRRHSTTSFSDNVVVAGTSYQMWKVSSFCHRELRGLNLLQHK